MHRDNLASHCSCQSSNLQRRERGPFTLMSVVVKTPLLYMLPSSMQMQRKEARTTSQDRQFSTTSPSPPPFSPPSSPFLSSFLPPTSAPSRGCLSALHIVIFLFGISGNYVQVFLTRFWLFFASPLLSPPSERLLPHHHGARQHHNRHLLPLLRHGVPGRDQ